MGSIKSPKPAKLIMSLITSDDMLLQNVAEVLEKDFGEVDFMSDILTFDFTNYYTPEMGEGLFRKFVTFRPLIPRESLVRIKHKTNEVEGDFAIEGKRRVNIDPGYLCAEHVILATTKGYSHRPYLNEGIYAELTVIYHNGEFQPLPWTYPDYASTQVRRILQEVRTQYLQELKGGGE